MKLRKIGKLILMLASSLLLTAGAALAAEQEVGPGIVYVPPEKELFELINAVRLQEGAAPLAWSDELEGVAKTRAEEITVLYSHTRPDGSQPQTAYKDAELTFSFAGENLAKGSEEAWQVLEKWTKSKASKKNLLREQFTYGAIAIKDVVAEDGTVTRYWVMEFMTPKNAPVSEGGDISEGDILPSGDIPETDNE